MVGKRCMCVAVAGRRSWTLDVVICPMWVESKEVPLGRRTEIGEVAGLVLCVFVLLTCPK